MDRVSCGTDIVDVHTHILPRFDDGSRSSMESVSMLRALYSQGIRRVVATPHFYARQDEPDIFIKNRDITASHLSKKLDELSATERESGLPSVYLGAEVAFFNAMSICPELDKMCISGTKYLLVEMPFYKWTTAMVKELYTIQKERGLTPIIAHIERYFQFCKHEMIDEMIGEGILIQSNSEAFLHIGTRGRALKLLEDGKIHLLGSDCHNMEKRAPNIRPALDVIEKRVGMSAVGEVGAWSSKILEGGKPIWQ